MNMKLLFWMNVFMLHFGIAYYLKDKINAELTAIIDTPNKPKQMFDKSCSRGPLKTPQTHPR